MKGKSLALLLLALGCGLVASLGITQVLKRGDAPAPADTSPVYVAKDDIGSGVLLNQDNTKVEQWPKDRVPAGAVTSQENLDGRHTRQKIYAGEPLLEPKLLARGQVLTDSLVPKGFRVVAITVSPEAIHNGLVLPGSRCDLQVFIRADANLGVGETLCKTILQDIRVFAVNDVTSTQSQDPKAPDNVRSIPGKTVSLLVTPSQAQIVTLASQLGMIHLLMRSGEDSEQPKTVAMTAHELLGASGGGDRPKEDPKGNDEERFRKWADMIRKSLREEAKKADPAEPRPTQEEQHFNMRVRLGTEVNDVVLINNTGEQGPGDEGTWTATGMGPSSRGKATSDTHGPKPADAGPAAVLAAQAPSKSGSASLPAPVTPATRVPGS